MLLALGACAPRSVTRLLAEPPTGLPTEKIIDAVPFVAQTEKYCGPASLAMVLEYYGQQAGLAELGQAVFIPGKGGSLQVEMAAQLRRKGLLAYRLDNNLEALLTELAAGNPVLILQNLGLASFPRWHYAVAIGYNLDSAEIILHSGQRRGHRLGLKTFAHTWARSDNWALVPRPVGTFPEQADVKAVFIASTDLANTPEQAGTAIPQYSAALERWPGNEAFSIALGNEYHTKGDYRGAIDVLLSALATQADSALLFNNLAYSLAADKCYASARRSVQCAVKIKSSAQFLDSKKELDGLTDKLDLAENCPTIRCD